MYWLWIGLSVLIILIHFLDFRNEEQWGNFEEEPDFNSEKTDDSESARS